MSNQTKSPDIFFSQIKPQHLCNDMISPSIFNYYSSISPHTPMINNRTFSTLDNSNFLSPSLNNQIDISDDSYYNMNPNPNFVFGQGNLPNDDQNLINMIKKKPTKIYSKYK